ncbi:MAG: ferrous iron transport protein B [Candidatus Omnitrophica bacterium]|nr:ferrous iron transport protein B [Candidatus Omnitrophota bacterium]
MLPEGKIVLVGGPNVGKSAIFNALTGSYVTVSNYPGTTVDVSRGRMKIGKHHSFTVIDTPGMYSLRPITAEEDVARKMLISEAPDCLLHIVDAKNLGRMLPLTFQLIETGYPVILVLNLYDEFLARGMKMEIAHLEHDLGIPVVETVATKGYGIENLSSRIVEVLEKRYSFSDMKTVKYHADIEKTAEEIVSLLKKERNVSRRTLALLLLLNDSYAFELIADEKNIGRIRSIRDAFRPGSVEKSLSQTRHDAAQAMIAERVMPGGKEKYGLSEKLSQVMVHPLTGLPILAAVLWFGLYKFVGEFGAGTLVDIIDVNVFANHINPNVDAFFTALLGESVFFGLFAGEYGIITLGARYAFAIILPIVFTFFIFFSVIEDSGYLPRLAMLVDRIFKKIGLSGRAVIPLTLGFGCDTMATMVTRTLESKKEKIIATFLLALAVPCSAQLGVLLGLLKGKSMMLVIWGGTVVFVFLLTGFLGKLIIKGEETSFFMELPPLRMPSSLNVLIKTYTRMIWYLKEIIPVFIGVSVLIWIGNITGVFNTLVRLMKCPVVWAGMPESAATPFLYGFFRRDFGAAGLFDMAKSGELNGNSLLIAAVVLTLFVPCVAQFVVTWKERGKMMAVGMALFIFPFAFFVGFLLNAALKAAGVSL